VPRLDESTPPNAAELKQDNDGLTLIEVQQFHPPSQEGIEGLENEVRSKLEALQLQPDQFLHFGRDPELPAKDTLEFSKLEAWHTSLSGFVWDPNSLSSFWFELVNGAYGDVYRAKGLMNLPDGRAFFCNWMVSQESSQFLPLNTTASPLGRPNRTSELVVQGKALNPEGIQATINDCLLADDVLAMQQQQLQQQQPTSQG
jgi:G3E family GTPase